MKLRRGVAAIIVRANGLVLAGERRVDSGWLWQLPQGGLEINESPLEGLMREVQEETGLVGLEVVRQTSAFIPYVFPPGLQKKSYKGQEHVYFVLDGSKVQDSDLQESKEFKSFRWMSIPDLVAAVVDWKRKAYLKAFEELKLL